MNYVVFEAGSRAGFSTEMFFIDYIKQTGNETDMLYMVDDSQDVNKVYSSERVKRISYSDFLMLDKKHLIIFPGDELTRQSKKYVKDIAKWFKFSFIENDWYNKKEMNEILYKVTRGCKIKVPKTFECSKVCVRPNSMSAGSKGLQLLDEVSITEKIDIAKEYVVDVLRYDDKMHLYPRQVILKNGYDRMIKPLKEDSDIGKAVKEFILEICPENFGIYSCIFHLQIAEDKNGNLYYIESSKRISGTSIVNIFRGMNPFCLINGVESKERINPFKYDEWYRYEDFIKAIDL